MSEKKSSPPEKKRLKTFTDLYKVAQTFHTEKEDIRETKELASSIDSAEVIKSDEKHLSNSSNIINLDVSIIDPDPNQPRKFFRKISLEELSASIRERGVDNPITVRPATDGRYRIVAGERRWKCSVGLGLRTIPAIIKEYTDAEAYIAALTENIQREDLHYLDESEAMRRMIDLGYIKDQMELSEKLGKSNAYVSLKLKVLSLPQRIKDLIYTADAISFSHAVALAQVKNEGAAYELAKKIISGELPVKKLESLISSGALDRIGIPRPKSSFQPVQIKPVPNGFNMTIKYRKDRPEDILKIINIFEQKINELRTQANIGTQDI